MSELDYLVEQPFGIPKAGGDEFVHRRSQEHTVRVERVHRLGSKRKRRLRISLTLGVKDALSIGVPRARQRQAPGASRCPRSFGFVRGAQVVAEHEERVLHARPDVRIEARRALVRRDRLPQQAAIPAGRHERRKEFRVAAA